MDRRQALRNIGLGAGFLVATPSIISLLQSCKNEPDFKPVFLSIGQGHALKSMVDLIIPSDEAIPGAVALGVHSFIDAYWNDVMPAEQLMAVVDVTGSYQMLQPHVKLAFMALEDRFRKTFNKELEDGKPEEFDQLLSQYLKMDKERQMQYGKAMSDFYKAYEDDASITPDNEAAVFVLLATIRGMTIWGWKTSEEIGKKVLWYDPVPGQQKGCIPLSEAGNGNAMAL